MFGNDVLLFSDKDCQFPSGDIDIGWSRWYRKAVGRSAEQLYGAERVLRDPAQRLFLDPNMKQPFPLALPPLDVRRVHRIVVAHGVTEMCRQTLGGSGTLVIYPSVVGNDHLKPRDAGGMPFAVGQVTPAKGYVHVLDDAAFRLLLRMLDTVSDFVAYLRKKEALISGGRLGMAAGEEALLGWYLAKVNAEEQHDFLVPDGPPVAVDESWWTDYVKSPEAHRKYEADKVSYLWDHIIELFAHHFRAGTSDHLSDTEVSTHEKVLYFFARENRTRRRMLSRCLHEMLDNTPKNMRRLRVVEPSSPGDPYWVLVLVPFPPEMDYRFYRETRRTFLEACCMVTKVVYPKALDIVGFATETARGSQGSEDAIYLDARLWTQELQAEAKRLQRDLEILVSGRRLVGRESEYPPAPAPDEQ